MIDSKNIALLANLAASCSSVCTVCHVHPDGDAIGSSAAVFHFMRSLGKKATVLMPDEPPAHLQWLLEGVDYEYTPEGARRALDGCDLLICLDFNTFSRTESLQELFLAFGGHKVLIDHHEDPQLQDFSLAFSRTDVSSTCELLYFILLGMPGIEGDPGRLPAATARALMTGMTTDTNNFANSVFPGTLQMASGLLAAGTDRNDILDRLYHSSREERLRAEGDILRNRLRITPEGAAIMVLGKDVLDGYALREGETEGFVNLPLEIKQVRLSLFAKEEEGCFRISMRSKAGTSARRLAVAVFHGGGHEQAAGGKILIPSDISSPEEAEAYATAAAARFLQQEDAAQETK